MDIQLQRHLHGVVRWLPVSPRFGGLSSEGQGKADPRHGADEPTLTARDIHHPTGQRAVPWRGAASSQGAVGPDGQGTGGYLR